MREAETLQALRLLVAALTHSARIVERRTGVTNAQLFLLRELAAEGSLSINELAARALTTQSTVSVVVDRLCESGLARRSRSAADARRVEVGLTPKGRRLTLRAPTPPTARLTAALRGLPAGDLQALDRSLMRLLRELGVTAKKPPMLFENGSA
jgi:MarR family transcriptional regulator, organic hydroperoxide resistance regulator